MKNSKKDKKKYYCKNYNINNKRKEELVGKQYLYLDSFNGVLITTDKNKEKNCVRDAYNILNDAVEYLYPDLRKSKPKVEKEENNTTISSSIQEGETKEETFEKVQKKQKVSEEEEKTTKTGAISDLLEDELKTLRTNKAKLFYNFETNCKGVVFIKLEKEYRDVVDVKKVVMHIVDNIKKSKEQVSKNISRFIPIEAAMKARLEFFQKHAPVILDKYFSKEAVPINEEIKPVQQNQQNESTISCIPINTPTQKVTWKLEIKVRNNNSVNKDDYLEYLLGYMDKNRFQVDYKNPQYVVLIEITNDLLCLSVLEHYNENKSYNLFTLSKNEEELKLERERLMNKQKEREEEKKKMSEKPIIEESPVKENVIQSEEIVPEEENSDYDIDLI